MIRDSWNDPTYRENDKFTTRPSNPINRINASVNPNEDETSKSNKYDQCMCIQLQINQYLNNHQQPTN
jgi:hypothetical protein